MRCIDCGVLQNYDFCHGSIVAQVLVLVGAKMQYLQVLGELDCCSFMMFAFYLRNVDNWCCMGEGGMERNDKEALVPLT